MTSIMRCSRGLRGFLTLNIVALQNVALIGAVCQGGPGMEWFLNAETPRRGEKRGEDKTQSWVSLRLRASAVSTVQSRRYEEIDCLLARDCGNSLACGCA